MHTQHESTEHRLSRNKILIINSNDNTQSGHSENGLTFKCDYLESLYLRCKDVCDNLDRNQCIIMGDFNINLISREDHGNDLLRLTETYGLLQLIMTPTRITNTSSTLIDHIYTNISSYCIQSGCIEAGISDHLPVYAVFKKFKCVSQPEKTILCRNFHTFSVDSFCDDLASIQWREVYECTEPNDAYSKFHNVYFRDL